MRNGPGDRALTRMFSLAPTAISVIDSRPPRRCRRSMGHMHHRRHGAGASPRTAHPRYDMSISVRNDRGGLAPGCSDQLDGLVVGPGDRALTPMILPGVDHGQLPGHRQHRPLGGGVGDLRGTARTHRRHERRCVDDRSFANRSPQFSARPRPTYSTHSGDLMLRHPYSTPLRFTARVLSMVSSEVAMESESSSASFYPTALRFASSVLPALLKATSSRP